MIPRPTQISGAAFLSGRPRAALGDAPRVGKTGATILALDDVFAEKVLIITTKSGLPVWRRALADWSPYDRRAQLVKDALDPRVPVAIVSWGSITQPATRSALLHRKWDAIIPDEAHYAKNFGAKRTQALYGTLKDGGRGLDNHHSLVSDQKWVWPLSGTFMPNSPFDIYPHLRALRPWCLEARNGLPDVTREQDFLHRYCVVRMKKISAWHKIPVVMGGRNAEELKERIGDFILTRTQADVGITEPVYEIMPLRGSAAIMRELEREVSDVLRSRLRRGQELDELEMELAEMRRRTGAAKAQAIVEAVKEEFECGLDKIVIAYWHTEVGDMLAAGLSSYGVVRVDGSTSLNNRETAAARFQGDGSVRVFLGQVQAAGEAIDLSSAAELLFAEVSFTPKDMRQMSLRITNYTQARLPRVRVAALEGSIDEALQSILLRKWSAIREVLPT